jgi:cryptochrome
MDVMSKAGPPPAALPAIKAIPKLPSDTHLADKKYNIPTLEELKVDENELGPRLFPGGETEALARMERSLANKAYVENFAKPNTSPNSLLPSTTVLSPYLKFGCLSARQFHEKLKAFKGTKTKPPVSLLGQLYWREFYYLVGANTPNFTVMKGNSICKQINWDDNEEYLQAWRMVTDPHF